MNIILGLAGFSNPDQVPKLSIPSKNPFRKKKRDPTKDGDMVYLSNYKQIDREDVGKLFDSLIHNTPTSGKKVEDIISMLDDNIARAKQYRVDFDHIMKYAKYIHKRGVQNTNGYLPGKQRIGFFVDTAKWDHNFEYDIAKEEDQNGHTHTCVKRKHMQPPTDTP